MPYLLLSNNEEDKDIVYKRNNRKTNNHNNDDRKKRRNSVMKNKKDNNNKKAIAVLRGEEGDINKNDRAILYCDLDDKIVSNKQQKISISDEYRFEVLPNVDPNKRDVVFLSGCSGAGKSYFTTKFCLNYIRIHDNKRKIYIVSQLDTDDTLDRLLYMPDDHKRRNEMVKRIPLTDRRVLDSESS